MRRFGPRCHALHRLLTLVVSVLSQSQLAVSVLSLPPFDVICAVTFKIQTQVNAAAGQAGDAAGAAGDQIQPVEDPKNVEQALDSVGDATESKYSLCD